MKTRFIFLFLLVSVVPALVVGLVSLRDARRLIVSQKTNEIYTKLEKAANDVNAKVNEKEALAIKFYIDDAVQNLLVRGEESEENYYQVMKLLFSNEYTEINDIAFLYRAGGGIYTNSMIDSAEATDILTEGLSQLRSGEISAWFDAVSVNREYVIPFIRKVDDIYHSDSENVGYFVTGIQEKNLHDSYTPYFSADEGIFFITNRNGNIISSWSEDLVGKSAGEVLTKHGEIEPGDVFREATADGKRYYAVEYGDAAKGWTYVFLFSHADMAGYLREIRLVPFYGLLLALVLSVLMSMLATSMLISPLRDLTATMKEVQEGDMDVRFNTGKTLEIRELGEFFNLMMNRLQESMRKITVGERRRREAEMKALVFQINPHFLYNTLSSVIWLTQEDQKENVIEMVNSLATLFRISISKGHELITIAEELEHAESYLKIQKIRFSNIFDYTIEADEELKRLYTIKILLQPLIENSVNHAMADIDYQGVIDIRILENEGDILLEVIDNGGGMTEEEVVRLNEYLERDDPDEEGDFGIGTGNVNSRVKLRFGSRYGLSYEKQGKNTVARVRIPMIQDPGEIPEFREEDEYV